MPTTPEVASHAQLAAVFARAFPALTERLARSIPDPDVERLVEGYVELAHRVDRVLSKAALRATQFYASFLSPEILRPFPAATILELTPPRGAAARVEVPAGAEFDSVLIEGTRCRFRAHARFSLVPFRVDDARLVPQGALGSSLDITLGCTGAPGAEAPIFPLRLHLAGERRASLLLLSWVHEHTAGIELEVAGRTLTLDPRALRLWGLHRNEPLLPEEPLEHPGFRLLRELFILPAKFAFFEMTGPDVAFGGEGRATLRFTFDEPPPPSVAVNREAVRTNCVPVVNVFDATADPVVPSLERPEQLIRPAGFQPEHGEVYAVRDVIARSPNGRTHPVLPAAGFGAANPYALPGVFYAIHRMPSASGPGADVTLTLTAPPDVREPPPELVLSLDLWATQRDLPAGLGVGAIKTPTLSSPPATFKNIRAVTPYRAAPEGELSAYHALALVALSGRSLADRASLAGLISALDLHAHHDSQAARALVQRIEAIDKVTVTATTARLGGIFVRGHDVAVTLLENAFDGDGEAFLFGRVIAQLLAHEARLNAFVRTSLRLKATGRRYSFAALHGERVLG
jgi:type VI secretion system protein ImpG